MDLNELFKDVKSFSKEAAMKENMRILALKDSVTLDAFRHAQLKLAKYFGNIKIDSPESNLTEFSKGYLSGSIKAILSVSTTAGLKRLPIHFSVRASVPTMVETPEQVVSELDTVEGSIDKEVKEILKKQEQKNKEYEEAEEVKEVKEDVPTIKATAKKKEIDLVSVENTSASQFPVKTLTYPKLYLPELKKGDIINIGGLKYKYVGEDKTISGEPGLNVYLELVCNTKKASLNVIAETEEEKQQRIKESKDSMKEITQAKNYIKNELDNIDNLSNNDIEYLALLSLDYETKLDKKLAEKIGSSEELSLWFLSLDEVDLDKLKNYDDSITKHIKDASNLFKVLKKSGYIDDLKGDFDKLPDEFKNTLKANTGVLFDLVKAYPKLVNEDLSKLIIKEDPEFAIDLSAENYLKSNFKLLNEFAEEEVKKTYDSLNKDIKEREEEDGSIEEDVSDEALTSIENKDEDSEDKIIKKHFDNKEDMINDIKKEWSSSLFSSSLKEIIESIKEVYDFVLSDEDFKKIFGMSKEEYSDKYKKHKLNLMDDNGKYSEDERNFELHDKKKDNEEEFNEEEFNEEEFNEEEFNEEEFNEEEFDTGIDFTDDSDKYTDDKNNLDSIVRNTSKDEESIEKESALDSMSFKSDLQNMRVDFPIGDEFLIQKVKEAKPELKNIPSEWFTAVKDTWSGFIEWSVGFDAKEDGITSFSIVANNSNIICSVDLSYFADANAKDASEETDDTVEFEIKLTDIKCDLDSTSLNSGSQLFAKSLDINDDNTATLTF